ncbi:unnamed protein product [Oreochromis niloticus]|nr:unnamed protein product [Mustela putorius furo]
MINFLFFCCLTGVCLGVEVHQSPSEFITKAGSKVEIFCSHEKTDYRVMLWYQQLPGDTAMKLIGQKLIMPTLFSLFWLTGVCLGVKVSQTPVEVFRRPGEKVQLVCSHEKTDYVLMQCYESTDNITVVFLSLVMQTNMVITFFCISLNIILVSGSSLSDQVHQDPADIYRIQGETAEITCSHNIDTYNQILWYKQTKNSQLQLLGHVYSTNPSVEPGVTVTIAGNANKDKTCTLTIKDLFMNSSAVYFCAARHHSATYH